MTVTCCIPAAASSHVNPATLHLSTATLAVQQKHHSLCTTKSILKSQKSSLSSSSSSLQTATKPHDFRDTLLRTLRYHYFLKVYLPMYRFIYAKQLQKIKGDSSTNQKPRIVVVTSKAKKQKEKQRKKGKITGPKRVVLKHNKKQCMLMDGCDIMEYHNNNNGNYFLHINPDKTNHNNHKNNQKDCVFIDATNVNNHHNQRNCCVETDSDSHSENHQNCYVETVDSKDCPSDDHNHNCEKNRCSSGATTTDDMNNKVVHFASHATVLHLGPDEVNDNWIYNNSQYLRASHPLDDINLNEDDSDSDSGESDDSPENPFECRCYFPQCTHVCSDAQCTHAHAQFQRTPVQVNSPCTRRRHRSPCGVLVASQGGNGIRRTMRRNTNTNTKMGPNIYTRTGRGQKRTGGQYGIVITIGEDGTYTYTNTNPDHTDTYTDTYTDTNTDTDTDTDANITRCPQCSGIVLLEDDSPDVSPDERPDERPDADVNTNTITDTVKLDDGDGGDTNTDINTDTNTDVNTNTSKVDTKGVHDTTAETNDTSCELSSCSIPNNSMDNCNKKDLNTNTNTDANMTKSSNMKKENKESELVVTVDANGVVRTQLNARTKDHDKQDTQTKTEGETDSERKGLDCETYTKEIGIESTNSEAHHEIPVDNNTKIEGMDNKKIIPTETESKIEGKDNTTVISTDTNTDTITESNKELVTTDNRTVTTNTNNTNTGIELNAVTNKELETADNRTKLTNTNNTGGIDSSKQTGIDSKQTGPKPPTTTNCICTCICNRTKPKQRRPTTTQGTTRRPTPKPIPGRPHSYRCVLFQSRRTDREEIRRKLAMGGDEDYYGGERTFKKPNLQTRLQHAMNLQICFMNPDTPATPAAAAASAQGVEGSLDGKPASTEIICQGNQPEKKVKAEEMEDEDFFAKQQRLQAEATMALAQVRPMAHMQLEIEKQNRKKSPIAEIIQTAIPGFSDGRKKKLALKVLTDMNVAQLQVVVNDLHTQIESLNEELVLMLVERDDLHMQQDSMLVNSEDLLARAQEFSIKVQTPKKKKDKKK